MLRIEHAHSLPVDDARARMAALCDYLNAKLGLTVSWSPDGSRAKVNGRYLVVTIDGSVIIGERTVVFEGQDPGMLWRGKAKEYLAGKLARYLDPQTPLASLRRS